MLRRCVLLIVTILYLIATSGERLNDTTLKQAAWDIINANTVGVWPPVTQVGGTDVLNPINEVMVNLEDSFRYIDKFHSEDRQY